MSTTRKLTKGLALLLMLALVLSVFPMTARAYSGSGTQADPYLITSSSDLASLRSAVNGGTTYSGVYFKLTADITTAQTATIGSSSRAFSGNFDGDGHNIALNISTNTGYQGLFAKLSGATIENLSVSGTVRSNKNSYVGGIAGYATGSTITNCSNSATVYAKAGHAAGIVGYATGTGSVTACFNSGSISCGNTRSAGIVGEQYTNVTVSNCYNIGNITGTSTAVGGIVGYGRGAVSNCYHAIGTISGPSTYGAIFGHMLTSSATGVNCYYVDTGNSLPGAGNVTFGTQLTVAQMQAAASSLGIYFESDTTPNVNSGYPILWWQGSGIAPNQAAINTLNGLVTSYNSNIKAYTDSLKTVAYANNDTITANSIYLDNYTISANNSGLGVPANAIWTVSSVAVSVPSAGYGTATVNHSTTEAINVSMTAFLTAEIDGVTYTSTNYVRYDFTISRDVGSPVTRTVYVSIFDNSYYDTINNTYDPIITASGRDLVVVPLTVSGYANTICVDDALSQLHTSYYTGSGSGYSTLSSGMIKELWGVENNYAFGIYRNDELTNTVNLEPIFNDDLITAFIYYSSNYYADRYLCFEEPVIVLTAGDDAELPIYYQTYYSNALTGVSATTVTVYKLNETTGALSSTTEVTYNTATDSVEADSSALGTYVLLATKSPALNVHYTPAVAMVKVGLSDAASVEADKTALTITTSGNSYYVSDTELPTSGANGTTITWSSSPTGIISSAGLVTRPSTDTQVTLTATITKGNGYDTKAFNVTVPAKVTYDQSLRSSLSTFLMPDASVITSSNIDDYLWYIMDAIVYEQQTSTPSISATDRASYYSNITDFVEDVITGSDDNAKKASDLAKAVIILSGLSLNNNTNYSASTISASYDNMTKTLPAWMEYFATTAKTAVENQGGDAVKHFLSTASFVLVAALENVNDVSSTFPGTMKDFLVDNQLASGAWSNYIDIDAVVLAALGYYYNLNTTDTDVEDAIDNSEAYLSGKQLANGSFGSSATSVVGNADSTAFVLIGLAAAGKDAEGPLFTKNNKTAVDGLLTFYNAATGLFQHSGMDNAMATEQAYRALLAYHGFYTRGTAYIVYAY